MTTTDQDAAGDRSLRSVKQPLSMEKLEGGEEKDSEILDWRGRPATKKHGGAKTSIFILVNQGMWNVANLAVATNLVVYFTRVLDMSNASAANNVTNWFGTMWLITLLGGFLGDSYLGRLLTCAVFQVVHLLGLTLLSLSVTLDVFKPPVCNEDGSVCQKPSTMNMIVFFVAIYTTAVGCGGYLPAFQALGADQFDTEKRRTWFFGWLYFFTNAGAILANTVFVYIETSGEWALGYWLALGVGMLALIVFSLGVPTYRQYRRSGNPFVRAAQVVTAAVRKWRVELPRDGALYEVTEEELLKIGSRKIPRTRTFSWLDKAATKVANEEAAKNPWRLCSVTQVEELKCLCRMMPIWFSAILFSTVFLQNNTLFVEQADAMDRKVAGFTIPPASMSVFNVGSIFLWTLLYPRLVVPLARRLTRRPEGLTQLQRMGVGQVWTAVGIAVAALVEAKRLKEAHEPTPREMSVLWLVPQQVLLGGAQVFVMVGCMDFFYTEAPHAMRGMVGALSLANLSIGSYASSVLVSLVTVATARGGSLGWIPPDELNEGHVDYFYWLLVGVMILNIAFFVAATIFYRWACVPASVSDSSLATQNLPPAPIPAVHPTSSPDSPPPAKV